VEDEQAKKVKRYFKGTYHEHEREQITCCDYTVGSCENQLCHFVVPLISTVTIIVRRFSLG